ncbi:hypothetical protein BJ322DRAFT_1026147 [Thelephora terrestris]|uniref:Uncharacterized protein n=1 Tax=Thelephora terrestris TaxID=56493 RepID=A0A9P6LBL7_9AGAM|nr:hypothetical protein BJ322DRAFT_1026147 [Thelephora terrestris]
MKHLSKIKRKIFSKFPKRPASTGTPPAGSPGPRHEQNAGSEDDRGSVVSSIVLQGTVARYQEDPTSEGGTSGVTIGGPEDGKNSIVENADGVEEEEIKPAELSGASCEGTAFGVAIRGDTAEEGTKRCGPLRAILQAISADDANYKGDVAVGNKIKGLLSHIVALEEGFDSPPREVEERRRRDGVIREMGHVEGQLRSLRGRAELRTGDIGEISRVLEGLRETIFSYQKVQQDEIYTQRQEGIVSVLILCMNNSITSQQSSAETTILNNFYSAQGAEY